MNTAAHLLIHVQPRAKRTELAGWHGDAVKVRVAAPPAAGAANDALVTFLANELGIPTSDVAIVRGPTSRQKRIAVSGLTRPEVLRRLRLA